MTFIQTTYGRQIDFLNPQQDQMFLPDIVGALSRNYRFGGHSPITVSQHICEVAALMMNDVSASDPQYTESGNPRFTHDVAEAALVGLIHDFPEFAVGDVPTPLKNLLNPQFEEIETRLLNCMLSKWELHEPYEKYTTSLKRNDRIAVQQEAVRFRMDGYYLEDDYVTETSKPFTWANPDIEVTLNSNIQEESVAEVNVFGLFVSAMIVSGRKDCLDRIILNVVCGLEESNDTADEDDMIKIVQERLEKPEVNLLVKGVNFL